MINNPIGATNRRPMLPRLNVKIIKFKYMYNTFY